MWRENRQNKERDSVGKAFLGVVMDASPTYFPEAYPEERKEGCRMALEYVKDEIPSIANHECPHGMERRIYDEICLMLDSAMKHLDAPEEIK